MKSRVVKEVRVGEQVAIGDLAIVKVVEKSGRNRVRLVFEVDQDVKLTQKPVPAPTPAKV